LNIPEDEKDLLVGCFKGDRQAQSDFVARFSNMVYNTVLNTLRTKTANWQIQDVEDLHQTVLIRLLERRCKRLRQFQGKNGCSLRSWVRMIAVHTVIDHLRSRKDALTRADTMDSSDYLLTLQSELHDPLQMLECTQQMEILRRCLRSLMPRDRLFIKLHCLQGLAIPEVVEILGITENNAYSIKHRSLNRLKTAVQAATQELK